MNVDDVRAQKGNYAPLGSIHHPKNWFVLQQVMLLGSDFGLCSK